MLPLARNNRLRACVLTASILFVPIAFADIVEPTPALPPADGVYDVADTCISVVCLEHITLSDFAGTTSKIVAGNEQTVSTVTLNADVFQNLSGMPGLFISPIVLTGQADITYFNKDTFSAPGTFDDQLTLLNLSGSFTGAAGTHTVEAMLNPNQASTGQTTVTPVGFNPPVYNISSFFDVFAELKIDDGPFIPGPERMADLAETPEPVYYAAIGLILAALVAKRATGSKPRADVQ